MTERTLPDLIRAHMQERGFSQAKLADRMGISPQTLSGILQGKWNRPSVENRRRIAAELGLTHLDILVATGDITAAEGREGITTFEGSDAPDAKLALSRTIRNLSDSDFEIIREHVDYLIDRASRNRTE